MNNPIVVVDADAIVAQAYSGDSNHDLANTISETLNDLDARMIYPVTAILEAATVLQGRLSSGATAYGTALAFTDPNIQVVSVGQKIIKRAMEYFNPSVSKRHTLFDCVVAVIAEEYKADAIFSFDKFYKSRGFTLAAAMMKAKLR